jgi:hypothetical protein
MILFSFISSCFLCVSDSVPRVSIIMFLVSLPVPCLCDPVPCHACTKCFCVPGWLNLRHHEKRTEIDLELSHSRETVLAVMQLTEQKQRLIEKSLKTAKLPNFHVKDHMLLICLSACTYIPLQSYLHVHTFFYLRIV